MPRISEGRAALTAGIHALAGIVGYELLRSVPGVSAWGALLAPAALSLAVWAFYRSLWKHYHSLYYAQIDSLKGQADA